MIISSQVYRLSLYLITNTASDESVDSFNQVTENSKFSYIQNLPISQRHTRGEYIVNMKIC